MNLRKSVGLALIAVTALAAAPSAFARSHVSIGLGISGPGYSIGYTDCHHCGWGGRGGYATVYGGGYYAPGYYASSYYAPAYYPGYYDTVVYERPVYRGGYYRDGYRHVDYRHYGYRGGYRGSHDYRGHDDHGGRGGHGGYYGH